MASAYKNWLKAVEEQEKEYADRQLSMVDKHQGLGKPEPEPSSSSSSKGRWLHRNGKEMPVEELASLLVAQLNAASGKKTELCECAEPEPDSLRQFQMIQAYAQNTGSETPTLEKFVLRDDVKKGVYAMGFTDLLGLQTALPMVFDNPNTHYILEGPAKSQSTTALSMLVLHRANPSVDHPQVLCLSPNSNSIEQMLKVIKEIGKFGSVTVFTSDTPVTKTTKLTNHVLVSTYGKISDLVFRKHCFDLSKITTLVIDALDELALNQDAQDLVERINKHLPESCQKVFFAKSHVSLVDFFEIVIPKYMLLKLSGNNSILDKLNQYYLECKASEDKYKVIAEFHRKILIGCAVVFCQNRQTVTWLAEKLNKSGYSAAFAHGEMSQTRKTSIVHRLRQKKEKMLILTDDFLTPKGLDLDLVFIINFDLPILTTVDYDVYLSRVTRLVRPGGQAWVFNLVDDNSTFALYEISKYFVRPIVKWKLEDISRIKFYEELNK